MSRVLRLLRVVFYGTLIPFMLTTHVLGIDSDDYNTIRIYSDEVVVSYTENKARFVGHVVVMHQQLKIQADEITVFYNTKTSDTAFHINKDFIQKVLLNGNVQLQSELQTIQSDSGEYDLNLGQVMLYKNVRLQNEQATVWGNKAIYDVHSKNAVISTNEGQIVHAELK